MERDMEEQLLEAGEVLHQSPASANDLLQIVETMSSPKPSKTAKDDSPVREIPKMSSKKKCSPSKGKATDVEKKGEDLVGVRIKVWWPMEEMFYEGVVSSFDAKSKKHTVTYTDGELEDLNLEKERWVKNEDDDPRENGETMSSPKPSKAVKDDSPVKETPKTSSKRKWTPSKGKATDVKKKGEDLVGVRIKVWWPMDEMFYEGVVDSFDAKSKKHKVTYTDGYLEDLNLDKERWVKIEDDDPRENGEQEMKAWSLDSKRTKCKRTKRKRSNHSTKLTVPSESLMGSQPTAPLPIPSKTIPRTSTSSIRSIEKYAAVLDEVASLEASFQKAVPICKSSADSMDHHQGEILNRFINLLQVPIYDLSTGQLVEFTEVVHQLEPFAPLVLSIEQRAGLTYCFDDAKALRSKIFESETSIKEVSTFQEKLKDNANAYRSTLATQGEETKTLINTVVNSSFPLSSAHQNLPILKAQLDRYIRRWEELKDLFKDIPRS